MTSLASNDAVVEQLQIMANETRQRLMDLNRKRNSMEEEIDILVADLRSPRGDNNFVCGLKGEGNLIDPQGFPRADIDIYEVRTKRHRYACLQTDHKAMMKTLEMELKALHRVQLQIEKMTPVNSTAPPPSTHVSPEQATKRPTPTPEAVRTPFAKVESVGVDSPADHAGLKIGDLILSFGGEKTILAGVPKYVQENITVPVFVERGIITLELTMTPMKWSGRGLLGCYLTPL